MFVVTDSSEGLRIFDSNGANDPLAAGWTPEPDEQTYCICNQVSYGEMVACDNNDVSMRMMIVMIVVRVRTDCPHF